MSICRKQHSHPTSNHSVRQRHPFSRGESGAAPPLSRHGKDIRTAHVLAQRGQEWQRAAESPALQTSFIKLELTVSLFQRNILEMVFFQVFSIFQLLEDVSSICVHEICLCPSSWIARFSNFYLLIFPLCTHQQYYYSYWAVFLSLVIILMIFYLSNLIWVS